MNMKLKRLILACLILSLFGITPRSSAQDGYPKTLNPADVLAEGVELVQRLPILNADNDSRMFYYFDDTTWTASPYPSDMAWIEDWRQRTDGTFLLTSLEFDQAFRGIHTYWLYDPKLIKITRPEMVCGIVRTLPGEGKWILYRQPDDQPYRLCFTETGQSTEPLPADIQPDSCLIGASPDGKWFVLSDCKFGGFSLYSYEPATKKLVYLGTNPYGDDENVEIVRWVDNTRPVIFSQMFMNLSSRTLFAADVTKSNSLQVIASDIMQYDLPVAYYFDSPPRYEWIPYELGIIGAGTDDEETKKLFEAGCSRHIFDLRTLTLTVQKRFPDNCGLGTAIGDGTGDRLYRNIHDDYTLATLMRFNFETGASRKLFTGKIAWIDSVSPGGQYAQLLFTQGELLRDRWFLDKDMNRAELPSPSVYIMDLKTGGVVFETSLTPLMEGDFLPQWLTPELQWIDNQAFILTYTRYDKQADVVSKTYRLVQLTVKGYTQRDLSLAEFQILSNPVPAIVWMPDNSGNKFAEQVDPVLRRIFPVTRALDPKQYEVKVHLRKDRLIEVTIEDAQRLSGMYQGNFTLHRWLVQIPGFSYF
jgi:hypothetical protein